MVVTLLILCSAIYLWARVLRFRIQFGLVERNTSKAYETQTFEST